MPTDPPEKDTPAPPVPTVRACLTAAQFVDIAAIPPEIEWLASVTSAKTRRAYKADVAEFVVFTGLRALRRFAPRRPRACHRPAQAVVAVVAL